MPFATSYTEYPHGIEGEGGTAGCFAALARLVVRRPSSTFFLRSNSPGGGMRFLIVDRAQVPHGGNTVLVATPHGLKEVPYDESTPKRRIWGTVVWVLEQV